MNEQILPRAILMDQKTDQQFEVNLQSDINPWPTEPDEEEPAQPMVFHNSVTFKITKKDKLAFKRLMRKHNKVPRKLKKALKHLEYKEPRFEEIKMPNGVGSIVHMEIGPKEGYPHTKWIRKAVHLLRRRMAIVHKIRNQGTVSHMGYRNFFK